MTVLGCTPPRPSRTRRRSGRHESFKRRSTLDAEEDDPGPAGQLAGNSRGGRDLVVKPGRSVGAEEVGSSPGGWRRQPCSALMGHFPVTTGTASPSGCPSAVRTHNTHMPNKTISVPDDVIPVIESLDVPFSQWVTDQLRRHAAKSTMSFADQLLADAALAAGDRLPHRDTVGKRMERSAPW